ncbi:hypothetical protein LTR36_009551 [Oleoguttula mirabilis]|uniref:Uncharacterized protein n=1 Tax=Oleoguttula mirabilis TaxID=1507867 RepID=A0AAV9JUC5_9PEZI|nr:hypothetical protein LTR36_009551 [Oleoguttula mirabilis]
MNGSRSPDAYRKAADNVSQHVDAPTGSTGHRSPEPAKPLTEEQTVQAAGEQDAEWEDDPEPVVRKQHVIANGGDDDANSEAETLIDSPVKKREAEKNEAQKAVTVVRPEKAAKSRIGSLPVPGDDDDDEESVATPLQSTEMSETKAGSSADASHEEDDELDVGSDKENSSSGSLSSAHSCLSNAASRASSMTRALSERPDLSRSGSGSLNPRKRKHRASSVGFPRKRQSMEPPKEKIRGIQSEDNAFRDRSPSPKLRSHRRTASMQSAFVDGAAAEGASRKRRAATQFPVRDPKTARSGWEESDASSETASHGHPDIRRPQRGIGRSTSTPGRPVPREHKRHVNKYGFTRLAEACEIADLDAVREWREKDPDQLELAEFAGNKPLQIAALNGNDEVVSYLIEQGCQIDCANVDKDTPLIDAAENGHLEVVRILLSAGVDPMRQNLKGQQALDVVTNETDDADEIRLALRHAIESWTSDDAKQRREEEEENRHRAGPTKELHFMARSYENLLRLVTNNDRTGVREFLDARVPVDNIIIAAAAKTGDQYLVNMLLAEMTEKKARSKAHKPMLAVLGTSHFDMVKLLTELDQFDPTYTSRQGKTWAEQAEDKNGPNWRQERELFQRLYDDRIRVTVRRSSSPVTKREGGKRRVAQDHMDDDSDNTQAPKRKNIRRLMSRRDMRAASGKPLSDTDSEEDASTSDTNAPAVDPEPVRRETSMKPPASPGQRRTVVRQRTNSSSAQSAEIPSPKQRRRSSSLRGSQDMALPTVEEKGEENGDQQLDMEKQKAAEAMFAVQEAQRLWAIRREEEAAEAEVKRAERAQHEASKAEEAREAEEARKREIAEQARRAGEEARRAEEARKAEEVRKQREVEMDDARRAHLQDILAALPTALTHVLNPDLVFEYEGVGALSYLQRQFLPLLVLRDDAEGPWVLNAQAAPLLGKKGLELLLPRTYSLDFDLSLTRNWITHSDFSPREQGNVQCVISALTKHEGRHDRLAPDNVSFRGDVEMEDDWAAELARTAQRLNAVNEAKAKLGKGSVVPLYCVKLSDVLANVDPLLHDCPIDARFLTPTAGSVEVAASLERRGIEGFVPRAGAFFDGARVLRTYRPGRVGREDSVEPVVGWTDVVVVHEK